ncbi:manganese ABC transporter ATP-binding protein [Neosynechococcus sphagnicola sy1]|uniref:Manganese ABC transporter ATP-binding protein n=1 Tax=Neosynechococcus sphagnicola sy1 TaxID=1497020 RepID=A0A098TJW1_9CYAN|nr:metal ABC transporter ATP-binding protein [Neosynechococcus sphagnicola]KGF72620.1 manganese ABC transporter ATP-binding protein [Neosynechococcus sphagnicola sy1]
MLEVRQLAVNYRGICGLEAVNFSVQPGQLVGVIGPNGAGKSTLLKAMLGLVPTVSGGVDFRSQPLQQQRYRVAYVPQRSQIDWDYPVTVRNVAMMGRTRHLGWLGTPGQGTHAIVQSALERVGIWDLRDRRIGELSGGQQQRVFLGRALTQKADLLLFDEPFTGVDQTTEAVILEIYAELRAEGKILLVSSHNWGQTLTQLDRLLLLNRSLIADGTPQEVMTAENLQRAYGSRLGQSQPPPALESQIFC